MVSKEKLKKQVSKTADAMKTGVKKAAGKGRNKSVPPHRHCRICHVPIDLKRDPPICGEENCAKDWEKNKKNERMVRIAFFVFVIIFMAPLIYATIVGR
jgi:predicted nucleic acid-binding Zn ribbon protein